MPVKIAMTVNGKPVAATVEPRTLLAGKLLGTYRKHNFGHIRFVLMQRRAARWNAQGTDLARLKPGHPDYERLRAEWVKEEYGDEQEVFDSIDAMIDEMRERSLAADELLDGDSGDATA